MVAMTRPTITLLDLDPKHYTRAARLAAKLLRHPAATEHTLAVSARAGGVVLVATGWSAEVVVVREVGDA